MLWLVLLMGMAGFALLLLSQRRMRSLGLPPGKVIYLDQNTLRRQETALFDPLTGISGRPDFLMQTVQGLVPVEVKSCKAPLAAYPSHVYQLAAYCRLVDRVYGSRPPYGVVKYSDRAYRLDYGAELEASLLDLVAEVRRQRRREQDRSHNAAVRCRGCGYREVCDQRLQ